ncbi:MAG: hypothetical protein HIU86_10600, partial [Acidobacteria bacterium]|nr:hypothetical protein [Acidobacteriota bacterium]
AGAAAARGATGFATGAEDALDALDAARGRTAACLVVAVDDATPVVVVTDRDRALGAGATA